MKKKERKMLKIKLGAAFEKALKDNRIDRTNKTERSVKKLIKQIVNRASKNTKVASAGLPISKGKMI